MTLGSLMGVDSSVASSNLLSKDDYLGARGGAVEGYKLATLQGNALLVQHSPVTTVTSVNTRNEILNYTVKAGDNPSLIAASFGITVNTLLWANKMNAWSIIKPGDELIILPVSGVMYKVRSGDTVSLIASRYKGEEDEIIDFNALPANGSIKAGDVLVIPDGEMYVPVRRYAVASSGVSSLQNVKGYFIWPTKGGYISQGRHFNNAIDIANSCGTPLYAAANGTVTASDGIGWNGGYGKYIKIQHPNGVVTRYAHNTTNLVASGTSVVQGQLIAYMGTTGRSTGCHIHFEVIGAANPFLR